MATGSALGSPERGAGIAALSGFPAADLARTATQHDIDPAPGDPLSANPA